jgi:hypothetical protein
MARKQDLPGFARKRDVLFGRKTSKERLRQTGEQFLEAGRYYDALEFLQRAGASDLTRTIVRLAIDAGDTALLMRAKKVLAEATTDEEWGRVAANAEKAGLYGAAYLAHTKAGHTEEAARLHALMPGVHEEEPEGTEGEA